jgi:hypothetical protein
MCHVTRCSNEAFRGIGCFKCHVALSFSITQFHQDVSYLKSTPVHADPRETRRQSPPTAIDVSVRALTAKTNPLNGLLKKMATPATDASGSPTRSRAATCEGRHAAATDRTRVMAGDGAVVDPTYSATLAITVDARPEHIWPWLVP